MKASNNKEEEPHFVKRDKFAITAEYKQWFADIKSRLRNSQIKAAIKVNSRMMRGAREPDIRIHPGASHRRI